MKHLVYLLHVVYVCLLSEFASRYTSAQPLNTGVLQQYFAAECSDNTCTAQPLDPKWGYFTLCGCMFIVAFRVVARKLYRVWKAPFSVLKCWDLPEHARVIDFIIYNATTNIESNIAYSGSAVHDLLVPEAAKYYILCPLLSVASLHVSSSSSSIYPCQANYTQVLCERL